MEEKRHRDVKQHAQGHTAGKWWSQDSNLGALAPESVILQKKKKKSIYKTWWLMGSGKVSKKEKSKFVQKLRARARRRLANIRTSHWRRRRGGQFRLSSSRAMFLRVSSKVLLRQNQLGVLATRAGSWAPLHICSYRVFGGQELKDLREWKLLGDFEIH